MFFQKFPLLAWAAWQLQYSLTALGTLRKQFTNPSEQVATPPSSPAASRTELDAPFSMDSDVKLRLEFYVLETRPLLSYFHNPSNTG